jgi:hypothetical protein
MSVAIKWGLILGVVVGLLGFVFGGAGLHQNPMMALVFVALAIAINIAAVVLCLRQAAATTPWGRQLLNGLVVGVLGAVIIFACSWTMTAVVFPGYYDQMLDGYAAYFERVGMAEDKIDQQMRAIEAGATPVAAAQQGAIGTVITSLVVAAIAGIFLRKK